MYLWYNISEKAGIKGRPPFAVETSFVTMFFNDAGYVGLVEYWKDDARRFKREAQEEVASVYHYHGGIVRKLFLAGVLFMFVALPLFFDLIPYPIHTTIIAVIVLIVAAGLTNPQKILSVVFDVLIALIALVTFEYYSIYTARTIPEQELFFFTNLVLVIIFLFALYFGVKTLRGMIYD